MHCKFFNTQFMSETEYNYQYLMRLKSIIKKFSVKTWKEKKKRYYSGFSKSLLTSGSFSFGVNRSWKDSWFLHFSHYKVYSLSYSLLSINYITTAHIWCDGYFTSIRAKVQVSRRELHTHIHLNYVRVEFSSHIQPKKKKNQLHKEC